MLPPVCLDPPICVAAILNFCHLFLILNILSIFQNIPLSFAPSLKLRET